jgi:hypothetical protein
MKMVLKNIFFLCIFSISQISAQTTLTLQPDAEAGKDAEVFNRSPSDPLSTDLIRGNAWTFAGDLGIQRGLFDFDFSSIPVGSQVLSAHLSLYSPGSPNSQSQSGENACYISRIIENWSEASVTWNNQPSVTSLHQKALPTSNGEYQDYVDIDVTQLVSDMVEDPNNSFGFMLRQQVEQPLQRMAFCSSDFADASKHPKLVITYTPPDCNTIILRPSAEGKDAEIYSLQPTTNLNNELFRANAWTFGGNLGIQRSLLAFDLSSIPANAEINAVYLSLYALDIPNDQSHSGDNGAVLRRITSSWNESTVNWNNQPSTTNTNQVGLLAAESGYQNFLNIDVTELVKDMVADPANSFGFLMQLQNEEALRRLGFSSSDYSAPQKHPKLEICYTPMVAVDDFKDANAALSFYPNPAADWLNITSDKPVTASLNIRMMDAYGRIVFDQDVMAGDPIYIGQLSSGIYFIKATVGKDQSVMTSRFFKN